MRIFEDNFEPIIILLKDVNGKEYKLETKFVPIGKMKYIEQKIQEISQGAEVFDKMYELMELLLGKSEKFWEKFSVNALNQVAQYCIEEMNKTDIKKKNG